MPSSWDDILHCKLFVIHAYIYIVLKYGVYDWTFCDCVLYNKLFSLGTNFPEWWTLCFSRNFPDLEIHKPTIEKSHMSNISYKVYNGKIIICQTHVMSTVIIVVHSCMVTTCMCTCTGGVSKNLRSSTVSVHTESSLMWPTLFWCSYHGYYK